jgi:hypothetical protein
MGADGRRAIDPMSRRVPSRPSDRLGARGSIWREEGTSAASVARSSSSLFARGLLVNDGIGVDYESSLSSRVRQKQTDRISFAPTRRRAPARRRAQIVLSIMPAPPPVAASSSSLLLSRVLALDPIALLACALFLMGVYFALVLAAGSSPLARIVLFKTSLFARSVRHLALSREKSGWPKTRPDPDVVVADVALSPPREKRVIFVRHGESTWNEVFNRGFGPGFPLRLAWGLLHEAAVIFSRGSFFVDAPLSHRGYRQARELRAFLKTYEPTGDGTTTNPDAAALRGDVRRVLIHTGPRTTASAW